MVQSIEEARRRQNTPAGRTPPHDLAAEQSVLGAMLLSREAISVAMEHCRADDFYKPAHGHVFEAISNLYGEGEPVDAVTVADELRRAGLLEAIGGQNVLIDLLASTPSTGNAGRYGRIVSDHALLRRLIGAANEIADIGYDIPDDVHGAIDRAESMVFDIGQRRVADTVAPLRDLLEATLDRLEALYERGDAITGVPTGYVDIDEQLSGLQTSNLVIVGARPAVGKTAFSLGIAAHAAMHANVPTLYFSLEMSHLEITQRLLSSEAQVNASRMRNGKLHEADWPKISHAIGRLGEAPLYVDDNPNLTIMDMRAKARRLKSREGLGLVIVDYVQLMTGKTSAENRQVEVSEISRGLKILARELEVPVMALSQLSRSLEQRADKRPMLADLRESGCLTGDARVLRADTGAEVTMAELLLSGETNIPVWSLDRDLRMVRSTMTHVFPTGIKPVFEMKLASGQRITASANHPFLTVEGWKRLEELAIGDRIATPRVTPSPEVAREMPEAEVIMLAHLLGDGCVAPRQPVHYTSADEANIEAVEAAASYFGITPRRVRQSNWWHVYLPSPERLTHGRRNPIQAWLEPLGLNGLRSYEKFIPGVVFSLPDAQIRLFVRHLWATDGSIRVDPKASQVRLYYSSTSRRMIDDLQRLLLRLGIVSRIKVSRKGQYRPSHNLCIYGRQSQEAFLRLVGVHGARGNVVPDALAFLKDRKCKPNADTVPGSVWQRALRSMDELGISRRSVADALGVRWLRSSDTQHGLSRARMATLAEAVPTRELRALAQSDVYWDRIVALDPKGSEPVYDATVLETHNFIANGIVSENSLEQDADVVMFLYRDEVYNADSPDRGTAEVIVAKHRNGPTGTAHLAFLDHYAKFANMAREH